MAQKKRFPSSILQGRKPPQTADRPPPSIPREQTVNGCSLSCILADMYCCCSCAPKIQKQRPEPLQKSDHDVQQSAVGRLSSKTGEPHRGIRVWRCPFAAVFARFCSAKSLPYTEGGLKAESSERPGGLFSARPVSECQTQKSGPPATFLTLYALSLRSMSLARSYTS